MNYALFIYILAWLALFTSSTVIGFTYYTYCQLTPEQQDRATVHLNAYLLAFIISIVYIVTYNLST